MKKHLALAAAFLLGSFALSAQMQVVKDAERALKDGKDPQEVMTIIAPAFQNPETAQLAQTYFIPGKAFFQYYDQLLGYKQFNKLPEGGEVVMAQCLLMGYGLYNESIALDSVPDSKGKIKTKYSKEIVNTIAGHFTDYNQAAIDLWEARDYNGAYEAWEVFLNIAESPVYGPKVSNMPADSTLGEIAYNQALAAWQADSLQKAVNSFMRAKSKGYNKKQLYDYAIAVATNLGDQELVFNLACEGQQLYGQEENNYFGYIINYYLQKNDFDRAFAIIDEAIAGDPTNAQYYLVKGILYDNQGKLAESEEMFLKAVQLNPNDSQILYNYGRCLCNKAYAASDVAPTNPAESEQYYNEVIVPLFRQAVEYLERAWEIDNDNIDALNYLSNAYYNLHDDKMYEDVEARKAR